MIESNLLSSTQLVFKPGSSFINKLISITYSNFSAFDANPSLEVRGVFLDLSKAFDGVWYKPLRYKLKNNGINGNVLHLIEPFLHNRRQRVVLNGDSSNWKFVKISAPQSSI